ncbi:MAG: lipid II:glycine glycyltransferase FemX [Planctomycetota bacterium]
MAAGDEYIVRTIDPQQWDEVVESFPDYSVFHTSAWLRSLCAEHKLKMLLVALEREGRYVAAWPSLAMRKGPFRILGSPLPGWSTAYMGPLIEPGTDPQPVLEAFLKRSPLRRWSYFNCRVFDHEREVDLAPFGLERGHREETYLIDLTQEEEQIWKNLKGACRTRVRKATKLGVEIRTEQDDSFIDEFWSMAREVFARTGIEPNFSRSLLETVYRELSAAGRVHVSSAYLDGQRISVLVLPYNGHTMYYWAGATFDQYRSLPAGNLLHWEAICSAKRLGLEHYDFINVSDRGGGGQFKRSFRPERVAVATHWEGSRHKLIGMLKEWYRKRRLRRRELGEQPSS